MKNRYYLIKLKSLGNLEKFIIIRKKLEKIGKTLKVQANLKKGNFAKI